MLYICSGFLFNLSVAYKLLHQFVAAVVHLIHLITKLFSLKTENTL